MIVKHGKTFRKTSCVMINKHFSYFLLNEIFSIFFVDFSIHYVSISIHFFVKWNSCEILRNKTFQTSHKMSRKNTVVLYRQIKKHETSRNS